MEQNRFEEYAESVENTNAYPEALKCTELRLKKRIRQRQRKFVMRGTGIIAGAFLLFAVIVNSDTAIADAVFDIPVIGTIAEYVRLDKGLQNAIKNDYVQEVNLTQKANGYTLGLPYVIADSKRLVLFFQLPKSLIHQDNKNYQIHVEDATIVTAGVSNLQSFSNPYDGGKPDDKGVIVYSLRTSQDSLPQDINLYVSLETPNPKYSNVDFEFDQLPDDLNTKLASYVFKLHLKPFPEPKATELNREVQVRGQSLIINSITEYPTGIEVKATPSDTNTSVINGLEFQAIDTKGKVWNMPENTISFPPDEDGAILCYLENDYFNSSPLDRIELTGIRMFKKSEEEIMIDLKNKTMSPQPSDLRIKSIEWEEDKANLTFEADFTEDFQLFDMEYRDLHGTRYNINHVIQLLVGDKSQIKLSVITRTDNKLILTRCMSPMIKLDTPAEIVIKK